MGYKMHFPEAINIYIEFGYSVSKNFKKAVNIIQKFPSYSCLGEEKKVIHSCHINSINDFLFLITDIEKLLFIINNWKSTIIKLNGLESNYELYVNYRYELAVKYPAYADLLNPNEISNCNCSLEKLPYPVVYYPSLYGAFWGFSEDINTKICFCECQREAIENYVILRKRMPLKDYIGSKTYPLGTDYFPEIVSNISQSDPENPLSLFGFKKNICFLCNKQLPHRKYCHSMYGTQFEQKYGWYINQEYFRLGIDPYQVLYNNVLSDKCPPEIYYTIRQYIQAYLQYEQDPENNQLEELISFYKKQYTDAVENSFRKRLGFKNKGEAWTSETILYHIVKSLYPESTVIFHYHPKWLDGLELDIWVQGKNLAFEYQGIQHFEPVEHWGGRHQLEIQQKHDAKKAQICKAKGITLITVNYNEELSLENIKSKIAFGIKALH